jgi:hypothetical protein
MAEGILDRITTLKITVQGSMRVIAILLQRDPKALDVLLAKASSCGVRPEKLVGRLEA